MICTSSPDAYLRTMLLDNPLKGKICHLEQRENLCLLCADVCVSMCVCEQARFSQALLSHVITHFICLKEVLLVLTKS